MTSRRRTAAAITLTASVWLLASGCSDEHESQDRNALDGGSAIALDGAAAGDANGIDAGTRLFDTTRVAVIALEVSDEALATLRADAKKAFNSDDFTYVSARLTFDGVAYEQVGLRVKGNSSRAMAQGDALPFKIDMNRYVSKQRLDGLTKLNLHNNVNNPAAMNEYLSYGAFREFGVAASRTGWADLTLNGQSLGLYTVVEQVNDKMLERWYADGEADLYKPESPAGSLSYLGDSIEDYTNVGYEADNDTNHATFLRLVKTIAEADVDSWNEVIDVESVLSYFAGNVALGNWDTYVSMSHNYYLFEAAPGRLQMLPWDMNLSQAAATSVCPTELRATFGMGSMGSMGVPGAGGIGAMNFDPANLPPRPEGSTPPGGGFMFPGDGGVPMGGGFGLGSGGAPLHDGLLGNPTYFARYLDVLRSFLAGPGSAETLHTRIDAAALVLGSRITSSAVTELRSTIDARVSALRSALATATSCPLASARGTAR